LHLLNVFLQKLFFEKHLQTAICHVVLRLRKTIKNFFDENHKKRSKNKWWITLLSELMAFWRYGYDFTHEQGL